MVSWVAYLALGNTGAKRAILRISHSAARVERNPFPAPSSGNLSALSTTTPDMLTGEGSLRRCAVDPLFISQRRLNSISIMFHTLHSLHRRHLLRWAKVDLVCKELVARNIGMDDYLVPDL